MLTRSPKFLAPALHPNVISTGMIEAMGHPDKYWAHWLCAGAGAGKTQGTRLWLEGAQRPYGWIQLDELDNDPFSFLEHLCECLAPLLRPEAILPELFPQGRLALDRHCEFVWDQLILGLREPSILVLDDAHKIDAWDLHPVLHHVLLHPHPSLHVVVVSRREIPQRYAREVVNRQVRLVNAEAFVWNEKHVRLWIRKRWKMERPSAEFLRSVLAISQGGAGVLALLDLKALHKSGASLESAAGQLELEALMEQTLLGRLTAEELEVLRWLACLGSFPERWLSCFAFPAAIRDCVTRWLEHSSVVAKLERSEGELRFHPLFAELLRRIAPAGAPSLFPLWHRIMEACLERGRVSDAMELAREAGDWGRYWALVEAEGLRWVEQGQILLLSRAVDCIPESVRSDLRGPMLSLFLAAASLHRDPSRAYACGVRAVEASRGQTELRRVWAMGLVIAASSVVAGGLSLSNLQPVMTEICTHIDAPWFGQMPASFRLTALRAGIIASMLGTNELPMQTLFAHVDRALRECEDVDLKAEVVSGLMRIVALHGLIEFLEPVAQHLKQVESCAQSPTSATAVMNAKASYLLALGQKAACVDASVSTLAGYSEDSPSVWKIEVLCIGAFSCFSSNAFAEGKRLFEELEGLAKKVQSQSAKLHWSLHAGAIAAHEGELLSAKKHYEGARSYSDSYGYPFMQIVARSGLMVIALELEEFELAQTMLREGDDILSRCNVPFAELIHLGSKAYHAMHTEPPQEARGTVELLLGVMRQTNCFTLALDLLPQYPRFLGYALEHEIEVELVHQIIRRAPMFPGTRPHSRWPDLYEAKVLGGFELTVNAVCERERFLSSGTRFQLLTVLLWYGKKGVLLKDVVPKIWYYLADEERQLRAFRAALKRLQDDLGRKDAVIETPERLYLNAELWSVDAWVIEEELARGEEGAAREVGLAQLRRGFMGPTPIPEGMRDVIPSRGGLDLGPQGVLRWLEDLF